MLPSTFLPTIGGAEVFLHNLIIHLQKLGHDVQVITWWGNWRKLRGKLSYPIHPLLPKSYTEQDRKRLTEQGQTGPWVARQVLFWQQVHSFDVFMINYASPLGPLCVKRLRRANLPVVMRCSGWDLFTHEALRIGARLAPALDKAIVDSVVRCNKVTASCRWMEQEYLKIGVSPEKIEKIPNGVDRNRILSVPSVRKEIRARHGIPPEAPLLLSVGRYGADKGFQHIPGILRRLRAGGHEVWWLVVGEGADVLKPMAAAEGVGPWLVTLPTIGAGPEVEWDARLQELPARELIQCYKAADIFVHPGIVEAYGNVVVEAMAAGTPVVTTDGTGAEEYVLQSQCGLVAGRQDPEDLADKIGQMLARPALREDMSRRALAAGADFDWPGIARQYEKVYRAVAANGKRA